MTACQCRQCGYGPLHSQQQTCPRCCRRAEPVTPDPRTSGTIPAVNVVLFGFLLAATLALVAIVQGFW
jgi:hypothetical protein